MQVYCKSLRASKSDAHRSITWTPSATVRHAGLLTIQGKRSNCAYLVVEMEASYPVRNFLMVKSDATPGTDKSETHYTVSVGVAGSPMGCTCKGFIYGRGKPCKHLEAADAILANGWLDRDMVNPDADASNTEAPF